MLSFHDFTKCTNIIFIFNLLNYNRAAPLYDTFHLHDMTHLNLRRPRRAKTGLLRLPKVTTVRFGNHSLSYQAVASLNLLQQYINIDDLSTLSLNLHTFRPKRMFVLVVIFRLAYFTFSLFCIFFCLFSIKVFNFY